jgi:hypothetical protein
MGYKYPVIFNDSLWLNLFFPTVILERCLIKFAFYRAVQTFYIAVRRFASVVRRLVTRCAVLCRGALVWSRGARFLSVVRDLPSQNSLRKRAGFLRAKG